MHTRFHHPTQHQKLYNLFNYRSLAYIIRLLSYFVFVLPYFTRYYINHFSAISFLLIWKNVLYFERFSCLTILIIFGLEVIFVVSGNISIVLSDIILSSVNWIFIFVILFLQKDNSRIINMVILNWFYIFCLFLYINIFCCFFHLTDIFYY